MDIEEHLNALNIDLKVTVKPRRSAPQYYAEIEIDLLNEGSTFTLVVDRSEFEELQSALNKYQFPEKESE